MYSKHSMVTVVIIEVFSGGLAQMRKLLYIDLS